MIKYKKILFETDEAGNLKYLNKAFNTLAFKTHPKILQELFHPEMPVKVVDQINEAIQYSQPWKSYIMLAPNGTGFGWAEFFVTVSDMGSGMTGYLLPINESALFSTKIQFACLKSFEYAKRMQHHIEIENLALKKA